MQCVLMCVIKVRNLLWLTSLSTSLLPADFTADDTAADAVFGFGWGADSNGAADGGQGLGSPAAVPLGACTTWREGSSLQLLPTILVPHQKVSELGGGGGGGGGGGLLFIGSGSLQLNSSGSFCHARSNPPGYSANQKVFSILARSNPLVYSANQQVFSFLATLHYLLWLSGLRISWSSNH